jgi:hypothetical protein
MSTEQYRFLHKALCHEVSGFMIAQSWQQLTLPYHVHAYETA